MKCTLRLMSLKIAVHHPFQPKKYAFAYVYKEAAEKRVGSLVAVHVLNRKAHEICT